VRAAAVVSSTGLVCPGEVVIDSGRITDVRPATGDVPHVVLAPGFVDLQVNGIGAIDVAHAAPGDWTGLDDALLAQGVTTWCPTLCSAPLDALEASVAAVAEAAARPFEGRPAIAGVHLEGPFLAVPGAHRAADLRRAVDIGWLEALGGILRVLTLAPELPGALEATARLGPAGVLIALGHSACSAELAADAADAGARLVTHLGNAMGPFHQRAPGLLGAALVDDRLAVSLIADLVHVHPVVLRLAFAAKGAAGVALVTDSVATPGRHAGAAGAPEPPRLADGTLEGSVLSMCDAVGNVVDHAAVALEDAVAAASTTPARLVGLHDRGALAPGLRADMVALERHADGPWRVTSVWIGGSVAWANDAASHGHG